MVAVLWVTLWHIWLKVGKGLNYIWLGTLWEPDVRRREHPCSCPRRVARTLTMLNDAFAEYSYYADPQEE